MPFDLSTAKPVESGFDLSTAKPVILPTTSHFVGDQPTDITQDMSKPQLFAAGAGKSVIDTGRGVGQLARNVIETPNTMGDMGGNKDHSISDTLGLPTQADVDEAAQRDKPLMKTGAGMAGNVAGQIAQLAIPGSALGKVGVVGKAAKALEDVKGGSLVLPTMGNAAFGASQPVQTGDSRLKNTAEAAASGAAGQVVGNVAGRLINPNVASNANVKLLNSEGVTPTIGQTFGGVLNKIEEKAQSIPILGDMISSARRNANTQFETAAYNRALAPIGQKLPDGLTGREALNHVETTLGNAYDNVLTRIGAIKPDQQFTSNVDNLKSTVDNLVMPKAEKAKFLAALGDINQSIDSNGVITSDAYKTLESSLGKDSQKLGASTNIYEGKLAPAVKQLQQELRDMLTRQAGPEATELQSVNSAYANFKRVQNAAGKLGADDGSFTPSQYQNSVRTMDKSKDKAAFARGSALGQDLGDAGKTVLGSKVPNSGTADRLLYGGGALGSYLINPAIPAALVGGAAMYTPMLQKLLTAAATKRPASAQAISDLAQRNVQYASPALLDLLHQNSP